MLVFACLVLLVVFAIYQFQIRQAADAQEPVQTTDTQGLVQGRTQVIVEGDSPLSASPAVVDPTASVRLEVPLIMQNPELPTGCEATATAMMLQYAGSSMTKLDVVAEMPYSDDPYRGFVGNPFTESGFTIYPQALMSLVRAQLGSAVDLTGARLADLKGFLQEGKPVCCWIADDQGYVHCVVITGYEGDTVFINDSLEGYTTMTASEFEHIWNNNARRALSY
jgi:uncharacterized protein YvpB